eukprot:TRINITY_DN11738_c0_g1_i1.p1 TRINITY_DN11738_c0_g1~~TRINITY_DN11738_c0_g1_i1.p1  ORF type:complete len:332 (+),score=84.24 TRINITY_DN11738_c0_g1_i1:78-998(+)
MLAARCIALGQLGAFAWLVARNGSEWGGNMFSTYLTSPAAHEVDWGQLASPARFAWRYGVTPFSHLSCMAWGAAVSVLLCISVRVLCSKEGAARGWRRALVYAHCAVLGTAAAAVCLGVAAEAWKGLWLLDDYSWFAVFCDADGTIQTRTRVAWWSYVYYVTRFYALSDAVVCAVQRQPVPHAELFVQFASLSTSWAWLESGWTAQWYCVMTDALAQVFQYGLLGLLPIAPRWRGLFALWHLLQLCSAVLLCALWAWRWRDGEQCAGDIQTAALTGYTYLSQVAFVLVVEPRPRGVAQPPDEEKQG